MDGGYNAEINEQINFIPELTFHWKKTYCVCWRKSQELYIQKRQTDDNTRSLIVRYVYRNRRTLYRFFTYGGEWAKDWVSAG